MKLKTFKTIPFGSRDLGWNCYLKLRGVIDNPICNLEKILLILALFWDFLLFTYPKVVKVDIKRELPDAIHKHEVPMLARITVNLGMGFL